MAVLTALRGLPGAEFMSSDIFYGVQYLDVVARTSTRLSLSDVDGRVNFMGTGFSYQMSGGQIVGMLGGTATSFSFTSGDGALTYLTWTGISISATSFFNFVVTQNWSALNALLFNTGDSYSLTDGEDVVRGFGGNDVMRGFGGADVLLGDLGNDKIYGDLGNDKLFGGAGNDTLIGGLGVDTLSGSTGADTFVFLYNGAAHRDIISDFNAVDDQLQFDNASFTALGTATGALAASKFVAGTAALDSADRFIYQKTTGYLWYDADGSGAGAKVLVADFANGTTLTAADIFII